MKTIATGWTIPSISLFVSFSLVVLCSFCFCCVPFFCSLFSLSFPSCALCVFLFCSLSCPLSSVFLFVPLCLSLPCVCSRSFSLVRPLSSGFLPVFVPSVCVCLSFSLFVSVVFFSTVLYFFSFFFLPPWAWPFSITPENVMQSPRH